LPEGVSRLVGTAVANYKRCLWDNRRS